MRVFLAGGTGAIGRRLVPMLVDAGHDVVATTRSTAKQEAIRRAGACPLVLDVLDRDAVLAAVAGSRPEAVVHQATALAALGDMRKVDEQFGETNELRTRGTDNLLAAALQSGARRFVAQSYAGWPFAREGGPVKDESDPLDPDPPQQARRSLEAIRHLETATADASGLEGLVLRYGGFYGPGTSLSPEGGTHVEMIRQRRFPLVGNGNGVWSFVHIDDAASATLLALERGDAGIYHVADDHPARVAEWLPYLAQILGAKPPRHVPAWAAKLLAGEFTVSMMTEIRGADNAKARRELGWEPVYPDWREGFRTVVAAEHPAARRGAA